MGCLNDKELKNKKNAIPGGQQILPAKKKEHDKQKQFGDATQKSQQNNPEIQIQKSKEKNVIKQQNTKKDLLQSVDLGMQSHIGQNGTENNKLPSQTQPKLTNIKQEPDQFDSKNNIPSFKLTGSKYVDIHSPKKLSVRQNSSNLQSVNLGMNSYHKDGVQGFNQKNNNNKNIGNNQGNKVNNPFNILQNYIGGNNHNKNRRINQQKKQNQGKNLHVNGKNNYINQQAMHDGANKNKETNYQFVKLNSQIVSKIVDKKPKEGQKIVVNFTDESNQFMGKSGKSSIKIKHSKQQIDKESIYVQSNTTQTRKDIQKNDGSMLDTAVINPKNKNKNKHNNNPEYFQQIPINLEQNINEFNQNKQPNLLLSTPVVRNKKIANKEDHSNNQQNEIQKIRQKSTSQNIPRLKKNRTMTDTYGASFQML